MKPTLVCLTVMCGCLLVQARSSTPKNGEEKDALNRLERVLKNLEKQGVGDNKEFERREHSLRDGDNENGKHRRPPPCVADDEDCERRQPPRDERQSDRDEPRRRPPPRALGQHEIEQSSNRQKPPQRVERQSVKYMYDPRRRPPYCGQRKRKENSERRQPLQREERLNAGLLLLANMKLKKVAIDKDLHNVMNVKAIEMNLDAGLLLKANVKIAIVAISKDFNHVLVTLKIATNDDLHHVMTTMEMENSPHNVLNAKTIKMNLNASLLLKTIVKM
eukprot:XP_019922062.1 PREDICTED: uncharacterized protein LOC109618541 [Crassostrea gigas]